MKVIIPLAGKGTRLRPHTHTVPKPMLKVAGRSLYAVRACASTASLRCPVM